MKYLLGLATIMAACSAPQMETPNVHEDERTMHPTRAASLYLTDRQLYDAGKLPELEARLQAKVNPNYDVHSLEDTMNLFRLAHVKYKIAEQTNDWGSPQAMSWGSAEFIYDFICSGKIPEEYRESYEAAIGALIGRTRARLKRSVPGKSHEKFVKELVKSIVNEKKHSFRKALDYVDNVKFLFGAR